MKDHEETAKLSLHSQPFKQGSGPDREEGVLTLFANWTNFTVARNIFPQIVFLHNINKSACFRFQP